LALPISLAAFITMCLPIFYYTPETVFPGIAALPVCLGTLALILIGEHHQTLMHRTISNPLFVWIGLASYSIYLWHWPILTLVDFLPFAVGSTKMIVVQAAVVFSIAIGFASLYIVEKPLRNRSRVKVKHIWFGTAFGTSTLAIAASWIIMQQGATFRFSDEFRTLLANAQNEFHTSCASFSEKSIYKRCRIGDGESPASFALIGDSHARSFSWAVSEAAKSQGVSGFVYEAGACPPLLPVETETNCGQHRSTLFEEIVNDDSIELVILSAFWSHYLETGNRFYLGNHRRRSGFEVSDYAELFPATVKHLEAHGKRVIFLQDTPTLSYNLPRAALFEHAFGIAIPDPPTLESYKRLNEIPDRMILSSKTQGAEFIETGTMMCDPDCLIQMNDRLLYYDSHHITRFASEKIFTEYFFRKVFAPSEMGESDH
ncbi:MAG: acyltransferase family protein, partial [Pseudomonadota bacterium]